MSINPEYDGTVTLRPYPNGAESEPAAAVAPVQAPPANHTGPQAQSAQAAPAPINAPAVLNPPAQAVQAAYFPESPRLEEPLAIASTCRSSRRGWVAPVAIGAVGIIASGSLGYFPLRRERCAAG